MVNNNENYNNNPLIEKFIKLSYSSENEILREKLKGDISATNQEINILASRAFENIRSKDASSEKSQRLLLGMKIFLENTSETDLLHKINEQVQKFTPSIESLSSYNFSHISDFLDKSERSTLRKINRSTNIKLPLKDEAYWINSQKPKLKDLIGVNGEGYEKLKIALGNECKTVKFFDLTGMNEEFQSKILENLLNDFPNIEELRIDSRKIKALPEKLSNQLKNLFAFKCNITKLHLPIATTVDCSSCRALTDLDLPLATTVNCGSCTELTVLNLPLATTVDCNFCFALTKLNLPSATVVKCICCGSLTDINLPLATTVDCSSCTELTVLNLPLATTVDCSHCIALTTLSLPSATNVDCSSCTELTNVDLPLATAVN
jgi:hypothetical protein